MKRIAAMPSTPAKRFQFLALFNAAGRTPLRQKFTSLQERRRNRDFVAEQAPQVVRQLRSFRRTRERSLLLLSIAFVEAHIRCLGFEKRALAQRR